METGVPDLFFWADRSVSGGDGGRSSLRVSFREVETFREVGGESADLDLFISLPPRSVASGVNGSVRRAAAATSSLLWRNSLLCALLKEGYGKLPRSLPIPLLSSGTRSVMELEAAAWYWGSSS